ncbi:MAG: tetratricopeptide repeat protein [Candidatus Latescibacterota bacterium]|nr:tetratricopeptide repeat protein [Candidatus Latescibacterota bacterium]
MSYTLRGEVADARIQLGIDLIYQLRFDEADRHFEAIIAQNPDNPLGHFFRAMVAWWRVLIDLEDESHDQSFYDLLDHCIEVCDRRLDEDPDDFDAILFKGGAIGFRGRLRGDRHQYLRAVRDGIRCLPLLKRSRQLDPANKDILFGQGIYNYFAAMAPMKFPIIRPLMLFFAKGDRELGIAQLEQVAAEGRYARTEAKYFLGQIYRLFEDDPVRALSYLTELGDTYPKNSIFHRFRGRVLVSADRWQEARQLYEDIRSRAAKGWPGYHRRAHIEALYYIGRHAFRERDASTAATVFSRADSLSYGLGDDLDLQAFRGYVSLANLYLGMSLDELGRRAEAMRRYDRVLRLPAKGSSHKRAEGYKREPFTRE